MVLRPIRLKDEMPTVDISKNADLDVRARPENYIKVSRVRWQSVMQGTHFASKHSMADLKMSSFIWMDMLMKFVSNNLSPWQAETPNKVRAAGKEALSWS